MSLRCAKCGSERVVPRAEIWDQGRGSWGGLQVYVQAKPAALLFRGTAYATLYARICGDCGYSELYADGAAELYAAHEQSLAGDQPAPVADPPPRRSVPEGACLNCGEPIPPESKACPACGWTWEAEDAG